MKTVYLIGGTMGIGKTTLCQYMKNHLENAVFLDGDWCWDSHPFIVNEKTKEMVKDNICHLLNNFIHVDTYEHILFAWVMHEQDIVDDLVSRLDLKDCDLKVISLICDEATLKQHILNDPLRDPEVLERSLQRLPLYKRLNTQKVDITHLTLKETMRKVIAL